MIRVVKPPAPRILRDRGAEETHLLCASYTVEPAAYRSGARRFEFKSGLYAHEDVKNALIEAQHCKCAFCESYFLHLCYGDVEHYRPKAGYKQRSGDPLRRPGYYWLAYDWENLFASCQLCNQRFKENLFPLADGRRRARSHGHDLNKERPLLLRPSEADPTSYLSFREEYAFAVGDCPEGKTTIRVLGLNRKELLEQRRGLRRILAVLVKYRNLLREKVTQDPSPTVQDDLRNAETLIAERLNPTSEYTAMARAYLAVADAPPS